MTFNPLSPAVIDAIRALNDRAITTLSQEIQDVVRAYVENGLRDGRGPRDIARSLREVIGMAPYQEQNLANRLVEWRAEFPEAQVAKMEATYRKRAAALNAETNARTLALDAQKLANHLNWQQQVESGEVDGSTLTKRWSGTLDDRERDSHLAMEGETVPWDQPYSNGQMQPGDGEFNCRCVSVYSTRAEVKAGAGARGVSTQSLRVASLLQLLRTA